MNSTTRRPFLDRIYGMHKISPPDPLRDVAPFDLAQGLQQGLSRHRVHRDDFSHRPTRTLSAATALKIYGRVVNERNKRVVSYHLPTHLPPSALALGASAPQRILSD